MILNYRLFLCALLIMLTSCAELLNEKQYRQYLQDPAHGLTQQISHGATSVTCTYLPTDLLIAQDLRGTAPDELAATADSIRKSYVGRTYLSLALTNGRSEIENQYQSNQPLFEQAIGYLNEGIVQDVFITTPTQDSVQALASTYSRLYGATGKTTLLLVFDTHTLDLNQGFTCTFRDTQFHLGTLHFPFTATSLRHLPALDLQASL